LDSIQMRLSDDEGRSFEEHNAASAGEARLARMLDAERDEIMRYKWIASERARRDLGQDAVLDWIENHASAWRHWYENQNRDD
jgi:ABC-type proline/glycine betaine transport system substrate-binding protein